MEGTRELALMAGAAGPSVSTGDIRPSGPRASLQQDRISLACWVPTPTSGKDSGAHIFQVNHIFNSAYCSW